MFRYLDNLNIRNKVWLLIGLFISAIIVGSIIDVLTIRSTLWAEKELKTRDLVETAYSVLARYHDLEKAGTLTAEAAHAEAIGTINALRYEEKEYFWINDLGKPVPKMIMHPSLPSLNGKVLDAEKFNCATSQSFGDEVSAVDTGGKKNLFVAMVEVAEKSGKGYVTYNWPKPKEGGGITEELFPKLSYVKKFEPWGWLIGSGIYVDDVDAAVRSRVMNNVVLVLVSSILLLLIAGVLTRSITRPLAEVATAMHEIAEGDGDLRKRLVEHGGKEIIRVASGFNHFDAKIQDAMLHIVRAINQINEDAEQLAAVAKQTGANVHQQDQETASVATSIQGMLINVQNVVESAGNAVQAAFQADSDAVLGKQVVSETINSIRSVAAEVENATVVISELEGDSRNIGNIVETIKGIADQTNLLALNAAIEAARAGDQGRGFAVVADEVRKLAQNTQVATSQIQELINHLQNKMLAAVKVMEAGRLRVDATVQQAGDAGESLEKITRSVASIREMNGEIASSAKEQLNVAQGINFSIENINKMAVETSAGVSSTENAVADLVNLLNQLQKLVGQFKL
jgi:methyl-accepting chemotaxis protein